LQVSLQQQALDVLQGAVGSNAAEMEQLQEASTQNRYAAALKEGMQGLATSRSWHIC
jgi:hypothetical protein